MPTPSSQTKPASAGSKKPVDAITKHILEVARINRDELSAAEIGALHAKATEAAIKAITPREIAEVKLGSLRATCEQYEKRVKAA